MTGKVLSKADIFAVDDLKLQRLAVPEWGGDVFIRVMTGTERDQFEAFAAKSNLGETGIRGKICALCLADEAGERLFSNDDIEALGRKSAAALERICLAVMKLNAITKDDVDELAKN